MLLFRCGHLPGLPILVIYFIISLKTCSPQCHRSPQTQKFLELFFIARAVQALVVIAVAAEGRTHSMPGSLHSAKSHPLGALFYWVRALVHRAGTGGHHRACLAQRMITCVVDDAVQDSASPRTMRLLNTVCGLALPLLQQFAMWAAACGWILLDTLVDGEDAISRCDALCSLLGIRTATQLLSSESDLNKLAIHWLKSTRASTVARCPMVRPAATNAWRFRFIDVITKSHVYNKIFVDLQSRRCARCRTVPKRTAICLVCGAVVCWKSVCCMQNGVHEVTQHSRVCGEGRAVYLLVRPVLVLATSGNQRRCIWGTFYLDECVGVI